MLNSKQYEYITSKIRYYLEYKFSKTYDEIINFTKFFDTNDLNMILKFTCDTSSNFGYCGNLSQVLLNLGADPIQSLEIAIDTDNFNLAKLSVEHGANPHETLKPYDKLQELKNLYEEILQNIYNHLRYNESSAKLNELLTKHPLFIRNISRHGDTFLHIATQENKINNVKSIINYHIKHGIGYAKHINSILEHPMLFQYQYNPSEVTTQPTSTANKKRNNNSLL